MRNAPNVGPCGVCRVCGRRKFCGVDPVGNGMCGPGACGAVCANEGCADVSKLNGVGSMSRKWGSNGGRWYAPGGYRLLIKSRDVDARAVKAARAFRARSKSN
jgi:hypothetical protein